MLIQHEETGRIAEIADGEKIPRGYYAVPEAARVRGTTPSPIEDPIGWRKWWMAINRGKTWADASAAWRAATE